MVLPWRSWVQAPIGSNQRLYNWYLLLLRYYIYIELAALRRKSKDWLARNKDNVSILTVVSVS